MAALVIVVAACTSSDIEIPQLDGKMHFTAKIAAPNSGSDTKTVYTVDGSSINVAWRAKEDGVYEGDKIALIHNGVKDIATVTAVDGSGNATIEATITGDPQDGDNVVLVYPAASVDATGDGTTVTPNTGYLELGFIQDGTLEYIQNNLDGRQGSGQLSVSGAKATLSSNVKMNSKIAIWKLNLTSDGTTEINAKTVTLYLGNQAIAGGADDSGKSEYYICVVPATLTAIYAAATAASLPTPIFTIEVNDGTDTYTYTKESQLTLASNGYYQSTVTMTKETPAPSYDSTVNIAEGPVTVTANEHWLIVGDGTAVSNTITIEDGATVTLQDVKISVEDKNAIICLGDAGIVLSGTNEVTNASLNSATIKGPVDALDKTLTISGEGKLTAKANGTANGTKRVVQGAAIGSDMNGTCGNIFILGGTVEASVAKDGYGAAIGAGRGQSGETSQCGNILISGGIVKAEGDNGAGIGSGTAYKITRQTIGYSKCGTITITGGTVTAKAGAGAAIGSGTVEGTTYTASSCSDIVITGGIINAETTHSTNAGAAIGAGANSNASNITISGGNVTAKGNARSAGIGAGGTSRAKSSCGKILINGGCVDATGGLGSNYPGAGIGTGEGTASNRHSICGTITITNNVIRVSAHNLGGSDYNMCIGKGSSAYSSPGDCGTVTIGVDTGEKSGKDFTYEPE